ncbi:MAG: hypothetical protein JO306_14805 [Gemmatimonadetes bacterium]|nr:hypothetical protein [Gemmatimonadota bacterium]
MPEDTNPTDDVQIEPLSDEELEGVAGGTVVPIDSSNGCCSCNTCSTS